MKTNRKQIHFNSYRLCNQVGRGKGIQNQYYNSYNHILYEYILTKLGCPFTIIIDQRVHFINDRFKHLTKQLLLKHVNSTTYYP
jgi:hypothetical protein